MCVIMLWKMNDEKRKIDQPSHITALKVKWQKQTNKLTHQLIKKLCCYASKTMTKTPINWHKDIWQLFLLMKSELGAKLEIYTKFEG